MGILRHTVAFLDFAEKGYNSCFTFLQGNTHVIINKVYFFARFISYLSMHWQIRRR